MIYGEKNMAKKKSSKKSISAKSMKAVGKGAKGKKAASSKGIPLPPGPVGQQKLPPELEKKIKKMQAKLDKFKEKVLAKFGDYIVGITVLPPEKPRAPGKAGMPGAPLPPGVAPGAYPPMGYPMQGQVGAPGVMQAAAGKQAGKGKAPAKDGGVKPEERIDLMIVVDDTTSKKMSKDQLHRKFSTIIDQMAVDIDKKMFTQSVLLTDLWQNSYDGKYDLNKLIAMSHAIYDKGMLAAIKIAEIHKSMVIKKFEKYILSYVLAGSLTQGRATATSDIDVWIVIDDTDVKKMSRIELKDKLRSIIIGMGLDAGDITGIKNKLNIQVYILTDFWDSLKEANPIIFTLLRDGVPFYDRGIFMPWKQLLRLGKIKPSREAIDIFMNSGRQVVKRLENELRKIGMEDFYYATLTPSQAALMLYGMPPPTPRETVDIMEEVFVKKEKLLEKKYVDILRKNIKIRKDLEHGSKKTFTGKELDAMIKDAKAYLERIEKLFEQIQAKHDKKTILHLYDEVVTIIRDIMRIEDGGKGKIAEKDIAKVFEKELVTPGKIPSKYLRDVKDVLSAKKKFDSGKLSKAEIEKTRKVAVVLIRFLVEYMQRRRGRELERAKIRVKHGSKFGEVTLLGDEAFIIYDIDARDKLEVTKCKVNKDGSLGTPKKSDLEEFEKALAAVNFPQRVFIKGPIFDDLQRMFGKDVEVLLHY